MEIDIAHQLYYANVTNLALRDLNQLETLSNKTMDMVHKGRMTIFHKKLPICVPSLGLEFLHEVQIHYDMNPELEMHTEKLQMLVSACVNTNQFFF
jgi:hypothetical protein